MDYPKFSVVIPYKQRLQNIRLALAGLADQTLDRSEFEVIVGALEYSRDLVSVCEEFADRLSLITVMSCVEWSVGHARNVAMRHVSGQVIVILDADMVVPPTFLRNLDDRYFRHGQNICVVGQMIGYEKDFRSDVDSVEIHPYSHYRKMLADLEAQDEVRMDLRWTPRWAAPFARFPWVWACTALIALPAATVREHGLSFDEGFRGWGPEDQEWARRVCLTGTPIVLGEQVYGIHLSHPRSMARQHESAVVNWRYYLAKWPVLDVELAIAFDGLGMAAAYDDVTRELAAQVPAGHRLGVVRGTVDGRSALVVGAVIDAGSLAPAAGVGAMFDDRARLEVLPLAGFALPYPDRSVDECRILQPILDLSERYRDTIVGEAERVSAMVIKRAETDRLP